MQLRKALTLLLTLIVLTNRLSLSRKGAKPPGPQSQQALMSSSAAVRSTTEPVERLDAPTSESRATASLLSAISNRRRLRRSSMQPVSP